MEIVLYPDPILRRKAAPIDDPGPRWRATGEEMLALMYRLGGVGLAAPQVGLGRRLLVLNPSADPERKDEERILLNPAIRRRKGREWGEEGCLSFPGITGEIRRAVWIEVEAQDPDGTPLSFSAEGFLARVIQHELDHLEGIVFIDRMSAADRIRNKAALEELEARYRRRHAAS